MTVLPYDVGLDRGTHDAAAPSSPPSWVRRLDEVLANCSIDVNVLIKSVLQAVEDVMAGEAAGDDRTLVAGKLT